LDRSILDLREFLGGLFRGMLAQRSQQSGQNPFAQHGISHASRPGQRAFRIGGRPLRRDALQVFSLRTIVRQLLNERERRARVRLT
jgi:hypothetical protein